MLNIFYSAIVTEVNVSLQRIANISNLGVRGGGSKSNEQYTNSIQIQGCSGGRRSFSDRCTDNTSNCILKTYRKNELTRRLDTILR